MGHKCHVPYCAKEVKPEYLMCFRHWNFVPKTLQNDVWRHYRKGQCDDKNPSAEWMKAADAAINAAIKKERPFHEQKSFFEGEAL